jgi:hypothetical protein
VLLLKTGSITSVHWSNQPAVLLDEKESRFFLRDALWAVSRALNAAECDASLQVPRTGLRSDYIHGLSMNTVSSATLGWTRSGGSPIKFTTPERPILTLCRTEAMSKYFPVQYTRFPNPDIGSITACLKTARLRPFCPSAKKSIMTEINPKYFQMTRKVEMRATQRKNSPSDWRLKVNYITLIAKYVKLRSNPITDLDRPLNVAGGWGSQTWRQSAHECGKVVRNNKRPPLPVRKYSWYPFLLENEWNPGA